MIQHFCDITYFIVEEIIGTRKKSKMQEQMVSLRDVRLWTITQGEGRPDHVLQDAEHCLWLTHPQSLREVLRNFLQGTISLY
jgi:hypothetical protein